ncbi:MAG TPA: sigma-70 family RNA polymerase sigma factor [Coleofasciculaceae cyanobacterium]
MLTSQQNVSTKHLKIDQPMRFRQSIVELFSTFMQFEAEHFSGWVEDARLRRSMQNCLKLSPEAAPKAIPEAPPKALLAISTPEKFWVFYWYRAWQSVSHPLAVQHLSSYLQEPCYWAAQQMVKKFTNTQYKLPDYFQSAIAEVHTVLKGFDPNRGASLKTYAGMAFPSLLRDLLRQRQETDLCTHWTLLRKVSKKRLTESLQAMGWSGEAIARYRLAWTCFTALYVPPRSAVPPDPAFWTAVAEQYNAERLNLSSPIHSTVNAETVEQWLTRCAAAIRAYLHPPLTSLNTPKPEPGSGEIQDDLPTPLSESLLAEMIAQEEAQNRQVQQSQLYSALTAVLARLPTEYQQVMHLYYKEGLTQQQIVQQLHLSQATVSRRLTKAREGLLAALVQRSQAELNISPTPTLIKEMSIALEEWLRVRYGELGGKSEIELSMQ